MVGLFPHVPSLAIVEEYHVPLSKSHSGAGLALHGEKRLPGSFCLKRNLYRRRVSLGLAVIDRFDIVAVRV